VRRWIAFLLLPAWLGSSDAAAQRVGEATEMYAGAEFRSLSFEGLQSVRRLQQTVFPVGLIVPLRRFRIDLGSAFVSTELLRVDSSHHRVTHLTDAQLRGSYMFGRDAVVATLALNLPTGPHNAAPRDYAVVGAVSPSFLGFPVAAYSAGFSATGGVATAIAVGDWSFGMAGSLRVSSRFTPYEDVTGPITYKPGLEGRVRGGADGLLGAARVSLALTYSTFGDDQFGGNGNARSGQYHPGPRWLAEAAMIAPIGSSSLGLSVWSFRRRAGDTTGTSADNRENLTSADLSLSIPMGTAVVLEPGVSGRISKPQAGRARMIGVGGALRIRLNRVLSLAPTVRYDRGWVEDSQGTRNALHGGYGSVFLRAAF
jgi:hypothetical protein